MTRNEETELFQQLTRAFDAPAFMRRARNVEAAWQVLIEQCHRQRRKLAEFPMLHLARLIALAGDWERLEVFCSRDDIAALKAVHEEWSPTLKVPLARAEKHAPIQRALREVADSFERFNARWLAFVRELDLAHINELRDAYNRYYVLEKECATRSARTARAGFTQLRSVTIDDVLREFPPLRVPTIASR